MAFAFACCKANDGAAGVEQHDRNAVFVPVWTIHATSRLESALQKPNPRVAHELLRRTDSTGSHQAMPEMIDLYHRLLVLLCYKIDTPASVILAVQFVG
jgi:hypothetical protein